MSQPTPLHIYYIYLNADVCEVSWLVGGFAGTPWRMRVIWQLTRRQFINVSPLAKNTCACVGYVCVCIYVVLIKTYPLWICVTDTKELMNLHEAVLHMYCVCGACLSVYVFAYMNGVQK